jgi:hypothetical protein
MKWRTSVTFITVLALGLLIGNQGLVNQAQAKKKNEPVPEKITVLSPMGTPPPIQSLAMAQRLDNLEGKTIYFVNDGYLNADVLLGEMVAWMERNRPNVKVVYKRKAGGFLDEDPVLWAEIKEKGDAMVMALGH